MNRPSKVLKKVSLNVHLQKHKINVLLMICPSTFHCQIVIITVLWEESLFHSLVAAGEF